MKNNIDLGVSLYGFTQRYIEEDGYNFREMFEDLNKLGIRKFELVGAQMFQNYPNPTDEEINEVMELAEQYDVEPFSYGGYVDFGKLPDHRMNDDEIMDQVTYDLMTAHKLVCKYIRGFGIPNHLYERVAQMAEFYQVVVAYEIHAPQRPSDPDIQELITIFKKLQSPWVGFVPDFGCYIEKPNELHIQRSMGLGAKRENLQYIIDNRWNGFTEEQMTQKIEEMGGGLAEQMAVSEWFGFLSFAPADIEGFKTVLPYSKYFHGKFYRIGDDCVETTIPYEELLGLVVESGFNGTIMIEYEGHSFYLNDAVEQIGRHITMEQRILAD